jgi:hypothetical protein
MTLTNGVPNLAPVDPIRRIIRCGQPTTPAAWAFLRTMFPPDVMPKVIKFNHEPGDELSGMEVIPIPISTAAQIIGPVKAKMEQALAALTDNTIVHCELGENRTGTFFIYYRMKVCGWDKARAIQEANLFEWEWSLPALHIFVDEL